MENRPAAYRFDAYRLDPVKRTLHRGGKRVHLQAKAFAVLERLVRARGSSVSTRDLIASVWSDTGATDENLRVQISSLRKTFAERPEEPRYIATTGRGYRFVAEVTPDHLDAAEDVRPTGHDIAVLPFRVTNTDSHPEHARLAERVEKAMTKGLVGYGERLAVRRVSPALAERVRNLDAPEAARTLRVNAVLEGELRVEPDIIDLDLHLTAADGRLIWTNGVGSCKDAIDRIVPAVVDDVAHVLGVPPDGSSTTATLESRNAYYAGIRRLDPSDCAKMREALTWFERSAELDPSNAEAHAAIAFACLSVWWNGAGSAHGIMQQAECAALRAIETDPGLPCGHAVMGTVTFMYRWGWDDAERSYRRALELAPEYANTHAFYAQLLAIKGDTHAAHRAVTRARHLSPASSMIHTTAGRIAHLARDYDTAIGLYREVTAQNPEFTWARFLEGWTRLARNEPHLAFELFDELSTDGVGPAWNDAFRALAASRLGKKQLAREIVSRLRPAATEGNIPPACMAIAARAVGRTDESLEWLTRCVDDPFPSMCMLGVEPIWDDLRTHPAFVAVLDQVGVPYRAPAELSSA